MAEPAGAVGESIDPGVVVDILAVDDCRFVQQADGLMNPVGCGPQITHHIRFVAHHHHLLRDPQVATCVQVMRVRSGSVREERSYSGTEQRNLEFVHESLDPFSKDKLFIGINVAILSRT